MSGAWDKAADEIMAAVTSRLGVTKGAGMRAELPVTDAVVRQLCRMFGEFTDQVSEQVGQTLPVLKAIQAAGEPEHAYAGFVPYRPAEWRSNQLVPNIPPQQMNGFHVPAGSNDDRPE